MLSPAEIAYPLAKGTPVATACVARFATGAEAPSSKAVILHRGNDWDKGTNPGLFIRLR